jgi:hypothetical protein
MFVLPKNINMKRVLIPSMVAIAAFILSSFMLTGLRAGDVRTLAQFDGIGIGVSADVYYIQGNTHEIRIEGDEKDVRDLITEVRDGFLQVKYDDWRSRHSKLTLYITSEELESVKMSGSGHFMVEKPLSADEMELGVSGSGSINFTKLESDEVEVKISGSGSAEISSGTADEIDVKISGSGKLEADGFEVSECSVAISGSGNVRIGVKDELDAKLSGSGKVYYRGNPRVNSVASGSGKVVSL